MISPRRAALLWLTVSVLAQSPADRLSISGIIVDPSGAAIPAVAVSLHEPGRTERTVTTNPSGAFVFTPVAPGDYEIRAISPDFAPGTVAVRVADRSPSLRITLRLAGVRQEVTVTERAAQVGTEPSENLDTVSLDRQMLDNLPVFDQDYVGAMSQFLDAGSIATGGVTLVVNGMEQKNIGVSASAIQQVKINQNPYSAEFSRPGRGRIEVITKPGSTAYHGAFNFLFRDYHLNARDPFATTVPPEQRRIYEGSLIGPLGSSGKTSFVITANHAEEDLQNIVYAVTPAGVVSGNAANPRRDTEFSGGVIRQFSANHVGSFRGSYHDTTARNNNAGGFVLPEAAVNFEDREDELYYNDSLVISTKVLNQFRMVFGRQHTPTRSENDSPAVVVPGAFTAGGAQAGRLQTENHVNVNDIVSLSFGKHQIKTGINVPDISRRGLDDDTNFGGTYTFASLEDYMLGRPFSLVRQQGDGHVVFLETVLGGFFQDEIRVLPNLTISGGLRYDWQNFFHYGRAVSPRFSFAYAPQKDRKTVLRGGAGIFYDRTGPQPIFDLERYNGVRLRQIVLTNPPYPEMPDAAALAAQPTTIARLDPRIRMPYTAQFSMGVERQLSNTTTLSVTYWGIRGVDLFRSRDVNAPPPPGYAGRPNPAIGVYRQIESSGHLQSDAMDVAFRGRLGRYFNGMIQYTLGRAYNDVPGNYSTSTRSTGINSFPANNYDLSGEWSRADYDQRDRLNLLGTVHAARYFDFGVGLFANTGAPYTETTGRDDYHDGYANARPPGVRRNSLQGPGFAELDLRWAHDIVFDKTKKDGARATLALDAFNVTNRVNYATFVGVETSPLFGQPAAAKPSRRLQLSARFSF